MEHSNIAREKLLLMCVVYELICDTGLVVSNRGQHGYFNQKRNVLEGDTGAYRIKGKQITRLKTDKKQATRILPDFPSHHCCYQD